ncbi:MAG: hypothetical protein AAB425_10280, partial [Bdellovibrionota bacterium]
MKKLLIVSYFYPPINAMGTARVASFVKHLPKFGWQPYVVTAKPGQWVQSNGQIPEGESPEQVCRTLCLDVNRVIPKIF